MVRYADDFILLCKYYESAKDEPALRFAEEFFTFPREGGLNLRKQMSLLLYTSHRVLTS
jgi:hypothetical protein